MPTALRGFLWLLLPFLLVGCQQFVDPSLPLGDAKPELPKESAGAQTAPIDLPPPGMLPAPPREFSTDWIAPGLTLGETTDICRIDLTIDDRDPRLAQIVTYRGTPEYNFFGDPLIEPQPDSPMRCRLVHVERRERNGKPINDGRQIYELQVEGRADWKLSLVVSNVAAQKPSAHSRHWRAVDQSANTD